MKIKDMQGMKRCELCQREIERVTKHHLIPKTRHKNKRNKKNFDRKEVRERVIWICRSCHNNVHAVLTEKELEYEYNTLESLAAHPEIAKFTEWIRRKPDQTTIRARSSKVKREKVSRRI